MQFALFARSGFTSALEKQATDEGIGSILRFACEFCFVKNGYYWSMQMTYSFGRTTNFKDYKTSLSNAPESVPFAWAGSAKTSECGSRRCQLRRLKGAG